MKPVSSITAMAGTSSVPRNDVSQGPRSGLRQNLGAEGDGRSERRDDRSTVGRVSRPGELTPWPRDLVADKVHP
jgi:hypothetical protein